MVFVNSEISFSRSDFEETGLVAFEETGLVAFEETGTGSI